jgi:O-antigen biosynthesis protein
LWAAPLLALSVLLPLAQIVDAVLRADFSRPGLRALTAGLFVIQPLARLWGRFAHGLTPWRQRGSAQRGILRSFRHATWSESWRAAPEWLDRLLASLRSQGAVVVAGGDCDRWDLQIRGGLFSAACVRLAVEEHGGGKQLLRWHAWPHLSLGFLVVVGVLTALALGAATDHAWTAASVLAGCAILMVLRLGFECARALGSARGALEDLK